MSRIFTFFAIAFVAAASFSMGQVNAQTTTTTAAVPPAGGLYQSNYGNQTYKIGIQGFSSGNSVEVQRVFPGTAAERLLLEAGDRIVSINGRDVRSMADLASRLQDAAINRGGSVSVLIDNVRARRGEYGAQRFVTHSTYVTASSNGRMGGQTGPSIVTPNVINGVDPNTGQVYSSNTQIDNSAFNRNRDASRNNGTLRNVKRPIYDQFGNLVGFSEGQVWNDSFTQQEYGNLNNTTIDQNGNVHNQRQIKAFIPK